MYIYIHIHNIYVYIYTYAVFTLLVFVFVFCDDHFSRYVAGLRLQLCGRFTAVLDCAKLANIWVHITLNMGLGWVSECVHMGHSIGLYMGEGSLCTATGNSVTSPDTGGRYVAVVAREPSNTSPNNWCKISTMICGGGTSTPPLRNQDHTKIWLTRLIVINLHT